MDTADASATGVRETFSAMVARAVMVLAVVVNTLMVEHVGRGFASTSSTNWFSCYVFAVTP